MQSALQAATLASRGASCLRQHSSSRTHPCPAEPPPDEYDDDAAILQAALKPRVTITSPASGSVHLPPASLSVGVTATPAQSDPSSPVTQVSLYQAGTLLETKMLPPVTSPMTFNITIASAGTHTLTVVATDSKSRTNFSQITVVVNAPPSVSFSSPAVGAVYAPGQAIPLAVSASDTDGTVQQVQYFNGSTLLHTSTASPFNFSWTGAASGTHSLTAQATDNLGSITTSAVRSVRVNTLPSVTLTAPATGALALPNSNVQLSASASDSDGTIAAVEFYRGSTLIQSVAAPGPYTATWSSVPAGTYTLTARVIDNDGGATTSSSATLNVTAAPPVAFQNPGFEGTYLQFPPAQADAPLGAWSRAGWVALINYDVMTQYAINPIPEGGQAVWLDQGGSISQSLQLMPGRYRITLKVAGSGPQLRATVNGTQIFASYTSGGPDWATITMDTPVLTTYSTYTFVFSRPTDGNEGTLFLDDFTIERLNDPPTVTLSAAAPPSGTSFALGQTITLTANASDPDGSISKVEFLHSGSVVMHTRTTGPFAPATYDWTPATPGTYTLTARATDNAQAITLSAPVTVRVNRPPTVGITSPQTQYTYPPSATATTISATASDMDGTIAKVEFFKDGVKIGERVTPQAGQTYSLDEPFAIGTYSLTVKATDNEGGTTTSTTVVYKVANPVAPTCAVTGHYYPSSNGEWQFTGPQPYVYWPGGFIGLRVSCTPLMPVMTYKWFENDVQLNPDGTYIGTYLPTTFNTLTTYKVVATNYGVSSVPTPLQFRTDTTTGTVPVCTSISANPTSVAGGQSIALTASGCTNSPTQYEWRMTTPGGFSSSVAWTSVASATVIAPLETGVFTYSVLARNFSGISAPKSTTVNITTPNLAPTISITAPLNNHRETANAITGKAQFYFTVNAADPDGVVTKVEYFSNGVSLAPEGLKTSAPFEFPGAMLPVGTHVITAKVTDNRLQTVTSDPITVHADANAAASVALTATPSSPVTYGAPVALKAKPTYNSNNNGYVHKVEFFSGNVLLGTIENGAPGYNPQDQSFNLTLPNLAPNEYAFRAVATDTYAGVGYSSILTLRVASDSAAGVSENLQGDTSASVTEPTGLQTGAIAGSFETTDSGAATYSIPVALPPGTAGMVPSVGLSYSSQGGGGLIGTGWNLSGLSVIHRCAKNYYTDGVKGKVSFDNTDQYCLDGQRLIEYPAGSQTWRTERDSFSRITRSGSGWKVEAKSGLVMYYGTDETGTYGVSGDIVSGHARWMLRATTMTEPSPPVKVWSLSKAQDRSGNFFLVEYEKTQNVAGGDADQRPKRIRYTGNTGAGLVPYASVEFDYESNLTTERAVLFDSGGGTSQATKRLRTITTKVNGNLVRTYVLEYVESALTRRSLLRRVHECGYAIGFAGTNEVLHDTTSSNKLCLKSTNFNVQAAVTSDTTFTQSQSPVAYPDMTGVRLTRAMDVNGDGKTDFIRYKDNNQWGVRFGGGDGLEKTWSSPGGSDTRVVFGDFNGDGRVDFVSENNNAWTKCYSNGVDGFNCSPVVFNGIPAVPTSSGKAFTLSGDFDGDGRIDIAFYAGRGNSKSLWHICLADSTTNGFNCSGPHIGPNETDDFDGPNGKVVGDFNGDGRADIMGYGKQGQNYTNNWQVAFSNFTTGQSGFTLGPENVSAVFSWPTSSTVADFNGDGLADIMAPDNQFSQGVGAWHVCLSRGDGTFNCELWSGRMGSNYLYLQGDFNGDGRTDVAQYNDGGASGFSIGWRVCLSTGTGFECQNWGSVVPGQGQTQDFNELNLTGDFDGSGKTDIAIKVGTQWQVIGATGAPPDMMSSAVDGLDKTAEFTYKPLTDVASGIYVKGTGAAFPAMDIVSPMYVVSKMSTNDGIGGMRHFSYTYKALRGHAQGAGLLGFEERSVKDDLTGRVTRTVYSQNFTERMAGMPTLTESTASGGVCGTAPAVCLSKKLVTYQARCKSATQTLQSCSTTDGSTVSPKIWEVYPTLTTDESYEPNVSGTAPYVTTTSTTVLSGVETASDIDAYGNVKKSTVGTSDGFGKVTNTQFGDEDTSATGWLLGRPTRATVTSSAPGASSLTRTSSFEYWAGTMLVKKEVIEPDATEQSQKLTTEYTYDAVGNRATTTISGYEVNARTSTVTYASAQGYRFATSARNALLQTASSEYDPRTGSVTKTTDANNVVATARYDRLGRKIASYNGLGVNQSIAYVASAIANAKMAITTTTSGAPTTTSHVDLLGREVKRDSQGFDGTTVSSITIYDARGRKTFVSRPYTVAVGVGTAFSYAGEDNKLDRVTSETAPDGGITAYGYGGFTNTVTRNPGGGAQAQVTTRVTNSQGWVTSVTDANTISTSFQYDALGNLTTVVKPAGGNVLLTYDIRSRKKQLDDPYAGVINYTYSAAGELLNEGVVGGRSSSSTYDDLGRLKTRTDTANGRNLRAVYEYDCANSVGKLCSETISDTTAGSAAYSNTRTIARDEKSRVTQTTTDTATGTGLGGLSRRFISAQTYDSLSRPKRYQYPITGLTLENTYNALGYADSVREPRAGGMVTHWQATGRNADGSIQSMLVGGLTTLREYHEDGRLKRIATGSLQDARYTWDNVGNLTSREDLATGALNGAKAYFCYDKLNRVTGQGTALNSCATQFTYNNLGDINTKPGMAYVYGGTANVLTAANGQNLQYDNGVARGGGNVTFDGSRRFVYNGFDLPESITQTTGGNTVRSNWGYGAGKQRTFELASQGATPETLVAKDITWFAGAGHFEFDDAREATTNQWFGREIRHFIGTPEGTAGVIVFKSDGTRVDRYFLRDHLGSSVGAYVNGALETASSYDIWGLRLAANNQAANNMPCTQASGTNCLDSSQRGYTGHEHLASFGLIHMNGRIYDPLWGRFLQADPIIDEPFNLQSYNRYSYVSNNPLAYTDPTGYSKWTNHRKQFWAVVAGAILGPGGWFGSGGVFGSGGLGWLTGTTAQIASTAAAGFAAGGIQGGNLHSALQGAVGAVASSLLIPSTGSWLGDVALNAGISCGRARSKGGSCGDAAANSVYSSMLGGVVGWAGRAALTYLQTTSLAEPRYPRAPDFLNSDQANAVAADYITSKVFADGSINMRFSGPIDFGHNTTPEQAQAVVDQLNKDFSGTTEGPTGKITSTSELYVGIQRGNPDLRRMFFDICTTCPANVGGVVNTATRHQFRVIESLISSKTTTHEFLHSMGIGHSDYGTRSMVSYDHLLQPERSLGTDPRFFTNGDRLRLHALYGSRGYSIFGFRF